MQENNNIVRDFTGIGKIAMLLLLFVFLLSLIENEFKSECARH